MNHKWSADDIILSSIDLDMVIFDGDIKLSILSHVHIAEISNVSHLISGATMSGSLWVVVTTSSDATIGQITELMYVESV